MNTKKKAIIGGIVACFILVTTTAIAMPTSEERIIEDLITTRNETLSEFYDGGLSIEEAGKTIKEIESGLLMEQDLDNLERYFQTDIDQVDGFEIKNIEVTKSDEDMICATVFIKWDIETVTGSDSFLCDYSVIVKKEKNSYKLVQFY